MHERFHHALLKHSPKTIHIINMSLAVEVFYFNPTRVTRMLMFSIYILKHPLCNKVHSLDILPFSKHRCLKLYPTSYPEATL